MCVCVCVSFSKRVFISHICNALCYNLPLNPFTGLSSHLICTRVYRCYRYRSSFLSPSLIPPILMICHHQTKVELRRKTPFFACHLQFFRFILFNKILRSISSRRWSLRCNLSTSLRYCVRSCCNCVSFCCSSCSILCKFGHEIVLAAASILWFQVSAVRKRFRIISRDCCKRWNFVRNFSIFLW